MRVWNCDEARCAPGSHSPDVSLSWPMIPAPHSITRLCTVARRQTFPAVPTPCPLRVPHGVTTIGDVNGVLLFPGVWEIGVNNGFDGTGTRRPVSG